MDRESAAHVDPEFTLFGVKKFYTFDKNTSSTDASESAKSTQNSKSAVNMMTTISRMNLFNKQTVTTRTGN